MKEEEEDVDGAPIAEEEDEDINGEPIAKRSRSNDDDIDGVPGNGCLVLLCLLLYK